MSRYSKWQKLAILAAIIGMLFNPMSYEILKDYIEWGFNILALACLAYACGFFLVKALTPEKVNIPKKNKKKVVKDTQYIDS